MGIDRMNADCTNGMVMIQGKSIAALLNPRPVALVTCCDSDCTPNVLSVAWHTPLSHDPPMVGISIDQRRYSHALISQCEEFVLNVVSSEFENAVDLCGNHSGREMDKFEAAGLKMSPAYHVRPPLIVGALAHLECTVVNYICTGDHTFFVGRILYAEAEAGCFGDCWDTQNGKVLLCLQRDRFGSWMR